MSFLFLTILTLISDQDVITSIVGSLVLCGERHRGMDSSGLRLHYKF